MNKYITPGREELNRFIAAQDKSYSMALEEIKSGKKISHWMWYIFPQLVDLGRSSTAKYYGIKGKEEAEEYISNELLRKRLIEISEALYNIDDDISNILGSPDDLKLKSCMTLFKYVSPDIDIFDKVLKKFYNGNEDEITINILEGRE